jgi:hypothetical protein
VRIVFDTSILVRSHQNATGPAREALLRAVIEPHCLILSPYILLEVERAFSCPRLRKRTHLTSTEIADFLEYLAASALLVPPQPCKTAYSATSTMCPYSEQQLQQTQMSSVHAMGICSTSRSSYSRLVTASR